jgi:hypothetical protein
MSERLDVLSQPTRVSEDKPDHRVDAKNHGFPLLQYWVSRVCEILVKQSKSRFRVHFVLTSDRQVTTGALGWETARIPYEYSMGKVINK